MSPIGGLCLFLCFYVSIIGGVEGAISSPPNNTVAEVNGEAIFNCTTSSSPPYVWILTRDGISSGEMEITGGCVVNAGLENHYRTEQPGGQATCNLIVFSITMEQAGVYHCVHTDTQRALLTVLEPSPVITVNSTAAVVENESVLNECSLNYNGSESTAPTLRPYFYWTNSSGQNVSTSYDSTTDNTAVSQLTVTAARENITSYTCHVYLQLVPVATVGYANNTPTVDKSESSPTIEVLYPVGHVNTSSNKASFACPNDAAILTCYATGHPEPSYAWTYPNNTVIFNSTIHICSNGSYVCNATNLIGVVIHSNTGVIDVIGACKPRTDELILSAVIPFEIKNLIVFVVFIICINCNKTFGVAMTNHFKWLRKLQHYSMDDALEIVLCICFVFGSIALGLIVIPVLITIAFCSGNKGPDAPHHEMNAKENQTGPDHNETGHAGHVTHGDGKKGSNSKWKIALMWGLDLIALFPVAFIVVYCLPCKEMRYEIV